MKGGWFVERRPVPRAKHMSLRVVPSYGLISGNQLLGTARDKSFEPVD